MAMHNGRFMTRIRGLIKTPDRFVQSYRDELLSLPRDVMRNKGRRRLGTGTAEHDVLSEAAAFPAARRRGAL